MLEPEERVPETRGNVTRVPGGLPTGIDFLHIGTQGLCLGCQWELKDITTSFGRC